MNRIEYSHDLGSRIRNLISNGRGCLFLRCINGEGNDLIAKSWHRKEPKKVAANETVIVFKN